MGHWVFARMDERGLMGKWVSGQVIVWVCGCVCGCVWVLVGFKWVSVRVSSCEGVSVCVG